MLTKKKIVVLFVFRNNERIILFVYYHIIYYLVVGDLITISLMSIDVSHSSHQQCQYILWWWTTNKIDAEVCRIINHCENIAKKILLDNRVIIDMVVEKLLESETLDGEEFRNIIKNYSVLPSNN